MSVQLTEAEKNKIWQQCESYQFEFEDYKEAFEVIERIIAARVAKARAEAWDEGDEATGRCCGCDPRDENGGHMTNPYRTGGEP